MNQTHAPAVCLQQLSHRYPPARPQRSGRAQPAHSQPSDQVASTRHARAALDQVSFDIQPGEIFGILGPNGSGKSTLFRILATLLRPSSGTGHATIFSHDVVTHAAHVRPLLGVVFQSPSLDLKLTVRENLLHHGHCFGLSGHPLQTRIDQLLQQLQVQDRAQHLVETLSGGLRRRVEIAKAMLPQPRLLLLDEPSTGLDPSARLGLKHLLSDLRQQHGVTIVLTTHLMDEAEVCDRLVLLREGQRVALGTPDELKAQVGGDVITLELAPTLDAAARETFLQQMHAQLGPWSPRAAPSWVDGRVRLEKEHGPEVIAEIARRWPAVAVSMSVSRPSLDDVFVHLTGQRIDDVHAEASSQ